MVDDEPTTDRVHIHPRCQAEYGDFLGQCIRNEGHQDIPSLEVNKHIDVWERKWEDEQTPKEAN